MFHSLCLERYRVSIYYISERKKKTLFRVLCHLQRQFVQIHLQIVLLSNGGAAARNMSQVSTTTPENNDPIG